MSIYHNLQKIIKNELTTKLGIMNSYFLDILGTERGINYSLLSKLFLVTKN